MSRLATEGGQAGERSETERAIATTPKFRYNRRKMGSEANEAILEKSSGRRSQSGSAVRDVPGSGGEFANDRMILS